MKDNQVYILNPAYNLRPDRKRAVLYSASLHDLPSRDVSSDFLGYLHPIFGIIFSFFDGENGLNRVYDLACELLGLPRSDIDQLISQLLENKEELYFEYDNQIFHVPKNLLIKRKNDSRVRKIDMKDYFIPKKDLDFQSWRFEIPLDILFMINNRCMTDCLYCYADRKKREDMELPVARVIELIREARALGLRSFDISGGELFLHSRWEEILEEVIANDFDSYISTKIPLDLTAIKKLKDMGLERIQVSIDSAVPEELTKMLHVKANYLEKIKETIQNLDDLGFQIYTNTTITKINQDSIKDLIQYLLTIKNMKRISVGAAGYSLYNERNYTDYRPDLEKIKKIQETADEIKPKVLDRLLLNFSGYWVEKTYFEDDPKKRKKNFDSRARCSGNFYAMVILPDGKVTVCEELYWHPRFIIGDVSSRSIDEVWNSEKAIGLYQLSNDDVREESACKECDEFADCHQKRGVCWKEILYAYGHDNWDWPDPKCARAPKPKYVFYL